MFFQSIQLYIILSIKLYKVDLDRFVDLKKKLKLIGANESII